MANLKKCEHCGSSVSAKRMAKHVASVHPDAEGYKGKSSAEIQKEFRRAKEEKAKALGKAKKSRDAQAGFKKVAKTALVVCLVVVLIGVVYWLVSQPSAKVGQPAPQFEVFDSDGYPFRLSEQKGKPVLVYFMRGTWCPSCKASMPALKQAWDNYNGRGLVMLTIDLDRSESVNDLKAYKSAYSAAWRFAIDESNVGGTYNAQNNVGTKVYIDKNGNVAQVTSGIASFDEMRPILDRLVGA